jgi:pantothenate kinase
MTESPTLGALATSIMERSAMKSAGTRFLAGIAGIPAAGKSTLATNLTETINQRAGGPMAVNVPMDGFHKKNRVLLGEGLFDRKGAPETFDAAGFAAFLERVKRFERGIRGPVYSRVVHDVVDDAYEISDQEIAIVEGNYLFLGEGNWAAIRDLLDLRIFLEADEATALERLYERQIQRTQSPKEAERHVAEVDLPNIRLVAKTRTSADIVVSARSLAS